MFRIKLWIHVLIHVLQRFDLANCQRLMPKINDGEEDVFFASFEEIAMHLLWPGKVCTLLIQCVLVGKPRDTVFAVCRLVLEVCKLHFQSGTRRPEETYLELPRQQEGNFNR